jgi:hypothetical protein
MSQFKLSASVIAITLPALTQLMLANTWPLREAPTPVGGGVKSGQMNSTFSAFFDILTFDPMDFDIDACMYL